MCIRHSTRCIFIVVIWFRCGRLCISYHFDIDTLPYAKCMHAMANSIIKYKRIETKHVHLMSMKMLWTLWMWWAWWWGWCKLRTWCVRVSVCVCLYIYFYDFEGIANVKAMQFHWIYPVAVRKMAIWLTC